ncbi:4Fe-4S dicluster domain-containing protein [Pedobacter alpinus]|uniref:4Fe-4S dicluster domain-containing protein n=1 Tax=Pedobacter alpinus TaxID=1590643 RepID=A0ABW5TVY1_9SPHI
MAIIITDECINCGACEPECPNNAIYDAGQAWKFSEGTNLKGIIDFGGGETLDADAAQAAISDEVYYIVSDKCTECKGFHDEPQCAAVCPVDCCIDDEDVRETEEELLAKKAWLHQEG